MREADVPTSEVSWELLPRGVPEAPLVGRWPAPWRGARLENELCRAFWGETGFLDPAWDGTSNALSRDTLLMNYECELENGQHLEIGNECDQTLVSFSSRGEGQQQSQGHGFTTGRWFSKPTVYRLAEDYIVRLETSYCARFVRVRGNRTTLLDHEPELAQAKEIELKESTAPRMSPIQPMEPMRPMEPMKPMPPMR